MSDLKSVQEEDLILVLKPTQQQKLVKAWHEQNTPSSQTDEIKMKVDKYVPPHLRNEVTRQSVSKMPSETESTPSSQIEEINKKVDKYVPPHLRNEKTRQSVSKMPSETENTPTNSINTQMDENNKKVDQYVHPHLKIDESNQSESTMPSETETISPATASSSSLVICNWKAKRVIKLLRRYTKYKTKLSNPNVKEQAVWKKIAYDSDVSLSRNKIDELRYEYERIKNKYVRNRETAMFLDEAKIAFETTETTEKTKPVKIIDYKKSSKIFLCNLLQVYAKYKTEPACPNNEEQKVWQNITKEMREQFSYACGEALCRFELLNLKSQYESSKRKNIKKGNMIDLFDDAKEAFETSENLDTASSSLPVYCSWQMKMIFKLLRLYTDYKPEFSHPDTEEQVVWKKLAQELPGWDESECRNKIDELRCVYERIKNENVTNRETALFLDEAKKAFETTEITEESKLLLGLKKTNRDFLRKLLQVYAEYKTELACPNDEEQKVWEKIAKEMREKFSYACGETLCRFELLNLKSEYESSKRWKLKNGKMFYLFHDAEEAFETPENLGISNSRIDEINKKVEEYVPSHLSDEETMPSVSTMSSETENTPSSQIEEINKKVDKYVPPHLRNEKTRQSISKMPSETETISPATASSSSLVICNWKVKRVIKLLRRYTKYKTKLSNPNVKKQTLWKKIAFDSDVSLSRNKIDELRYEYERIKNMYVRNRETAMFLDEAKIAFETTEITDEAKPVKLLDFKKSNKGFLHKLLKVYTKCKTELAYPNNEEQKIWQNIIKEMREHFSYACGETLCRFELFQLECQYEDSKRKNIKKGNMTDLFDDSKEAFETSENLVTASSSFPVYGWELKMIIKLLRLYTNYKPEFSHPDIEEQIVWKKLAQELSDWDESECRNKINELRCLYERIKNKDVTNRETAMFLNEAKESFETTEITEESKPLLLLGLKSSNRDFLRKLLQVYANYKTKPACQNDEEQNVWKKIAKEMREKFSYGCGETLCRFELLNLRSQYERSKRWKIVNRNMFHLFHDAEEAFETPENLDTSNSQIGEINKKVEECVPLHLSNEETMQSVSIMPSETKSLQR